MAGAGCGNKLWDPSQVGRFRPTPAVNVILDSLGVADEAPLAWEAAEEPRPSDIMAERGDYVLCPGDIIRVSIFELYAEGQMVSNEYVINESGRISIPDVGLIPAVGMTETQLEESIRKILTPNILKNPSVSVTMLNSEQRTFSVIGDGVDAPGRHVIPRYDFRLTDALATVKGPRQFNVSNIYVSRSVRNQTPAKVSSTRTPGGVPARMDAGGQSGPTVASTQNPSVPSWANGSVARERALVGMVPSSSSPSWQQASNQVIASADFPKAYGLNASPEVISGSSFEKVGGASQVQDTANPLAQGTYGSQARQADRPAGQRGVDIEWVFQDGRWVPVAAAGQRPATSQVDTPMTYPSRTQPPMDADRPLGITPQSMASDLPVAKAQASRSSAAPDAGTGAGGIDWVFQNGRWIPVPSTGRPSERPQGDTQATSPFRSSQRQDAAAGVQTNPRSTSYDLAPVPAAADGAYAASDQAAGGSGVEWVFQDGRWVPVQRGGAETARQLPTQFSPSERVMPLDQDEKKTAQDLTWEEAIRSRLIRIPTDKLLAGDPRYNIVIQPGDTIHVPVDIVGECCIMGNVTRAGYLNLTGRPMTLKMAIAAAGGLGPLAYPKNCEVVRRIGDKREEIVLVDLDKIASGEQPDFFIKPNDLINVGTHYTARWRAVLRNAFRATYGFGFVYDRNFADAEYGKGWQF